MHRAVVAELIKIGPDAYGDFDAVLKSAQGKVRSNAATVASSLRRSRHARVGVAVSLSNWTRRPALRLSFRDSNSSRVVGGKDCGNRSFSDFREMFLLDDIPSSGEYSP